MRLPSPVILLSLVVGSAACGVEHPMEAPGIIEPGVDASLDAPAQLNCDGENQGTPGADIPPRGDETALHAYLKARAYTNWTHESKPHESRGPHGQFDRVFINPALQAAMMQGGNGEYPLGVAAVNEIYDMSCVLRGWAVTIKYANSQNGDQNTFKNHGWYFYETYKVNDPTDIVAAGSGTTQATRACWDCHDGWDDNPQRTTVNPDYVWTRYPLR